MYLLIIYFCFSSFMCTILFGKFLGYNGSIIYNVSSILISFLCSLFIFYEVCILNVDCYINYITWLNIVSIDIYWSILFDSITSTMLVVICFVSLCANVYSAEYMLLEPHKVRFFNYLSLFTFTMLVLVTSNTLIQLFLGWECVGISSYLLINFWYTRIEANKSSILAIMANKTGDVFLLFTCLFLLCNYNSLYFNVIILTTDYNFEYVNISYNALSSNEVFGYLFLHDTMLTSLITSNNFINLNSFLNLNTYLYTTTWICFFIVLASICKSAQSGFHFWLSEAMEGPTPVSSLLHAATMVTAGIFLTVRCSFLFSNCSYIPIFIIFVGSVTSFFSSLIGIAQNDFKKIIAYSTCSQLGYMFLSNGLFAYNYTMFHLFNHAFFKALLFLTAGYIIHMFSNEQDLRKYGGLLKVLPFSYICILIGSVSLMGVPFLSGFFSKDTIIENMYSLFINIESYSFSYYVIFFSQLILSISILFTIFYSIKIIFYVFINKYNGFLFYLRNAHFSSKITVFPLFILSLLSIVTGFLFSDMMIGLGTTFWKNSIYHLNYFIDSCNTLTGVINSNFIFITTPYDVNKYTYYYVIVYTIYFLFMSFFILVTTSNQFVLYESLYKYAYMNLSSKVLFLNKLLISPISYAFYLQSHFTTYKLLDKTIFEVVGPFGIVYFLQHSTNRINKLNTGEIYHYIGIMILFLNAFFLFSYCI